MKILLLTDMPPSKQYPASLVLDRLCRLLPKDSIVCFAVVDPHLSPKISPDLDWIPIEYHNRPRESWSIKPKIVGNIASAVMESYNSQVESKRIAAKAIKFGLKHKVTAVWSILEGQTLIRLANPVAKGLKIPLLTQVFDPPTWWLRANEVDKYNQAAVLKEFASALRNSSYCATASWAMAREYNSDYGVKTIPILPSIDASEALSSCNMLHSSDELVIGMAGQTYASEEWNALIRALQSVNWMVCNRKVKIRLMGRAINVSTLGAVNIEFLGWNSQGETIKLMADSDILYCPYWFDPEFKVEASLSFPSKLTTYLASGRPVLFHGPQYSSPAVFLEENRAGYCCYSLNTDDIIAALTKICSDQELYAGVAASGKMAFNKFLTLTSMEESFHEFIKAGG